MEHNGTATKYRQWMTTEDSSRAPQHEMKNLYWIATMIHKWKTDNGLDDKGPSLNNGTSSGARQVAALMIRVE